MKEGFTIATFIGLWAGMWIGFFVGNREFVLFIMANLILWAVVDIMFMLVKTVKTFREIKDIVRLAETH